MEIYQLQYFVKVCECKSLSLAANYLHVSPPAVTIAIQKLEAEYGIQLFDRERHAMILTPVGQQFLELTIPVLDAVSNLNASIGALKQDYEGEMFIGCLRGDHFSSHHLYQFNQAFPRMHVTTIQATTDFIKDCLRKRQLDCALLFKDAVTPEFDSLFYSLTEWKIGVKAELAQSGEPFEAEALQGYDIFMPFAEPMLKEALERYLIENNITANIHVVNNPTPQAINSGYPKRTSLLGPSSPGSPQHGYFPVSLEPPFQIETMLVWLKNKTLTPHLSTFISIAKKNTYRRS